MSGINTSPPSGQSPATAEIMAALTGQTPAVGDGYAPPAEKRIPRETPVVEEARRKLVMRKQADVRADKTHHDPVFKRMKENSRFTYGDQWDRARTDDPGKRDGRYVVNIALRHVQQRTASLYATNPTVIASKRERMMATVWDGDMATLQQAQQEMAQAAQAQAATGRPLVPGSSLPGLSANALAILTDVKNVQTYDRMLTRVCKTLELLWKSEVDAQTFPFKTMMKATVRQTIIKSVGYVKLGFVRSMKMQPEIETRIASALEQMAKIKQISDDIADGELEQESAEAEQLRLMIEDLQTHPQIITREGLLFDYPDSQSVIPHYKCKNLRGFLGADWVTQEYLLSADQIHQTYGVDVGTSFATYAPDGNVRRAGDDGDSVKSSALGAVWEQYDRTDGLVYIMCDGYPDFLSEPAPPEVMINQFYPWFAMVLNEGHSEKQLYPPSDIDLIRDAQQEINRARQGLREHRHANRPKMFVPKGMLDEADITGMSAHPANAVIELNALAPGQKIEDVLQAYKGTPIEETLYDTDQAFEDILRALGQDQASSGQTTSATATEAAVAQASQQTDLASCLDDQDELLSAIARAAGKILMMNVSAQTVQRVIGPGAIWPELSTEQVMENIYLTVQAGSTGRPNKQQQVQNAQVLFPMLQRLPGISPEWMARELIKRLDDRLDLTDAFVEGMPSMDALNRIQGTVATPPPVDPGNGAPPPGPAPTAPPPPGPGPASPPMGGAPNDPTMQGAQGQQNAVAPPPTNGLLGPRTPPVPGSGGLSPGTLGGGPRLTRQGGVPVP